MVAKMDHSMSRVIAGALNPTVHDARRLNEPLRRLTIVPRLF